MPAPRLLGGPPNLLGDGHGEDEEYTDEQHPQSHQTSRVVRSRAHVDHLLLRTVGPWPVTDARSRPRHSADEAIGPIDDLWREREPQRSRNLQVNDKLNLRVHFDGNLRRTDTFDNFVDYTCGHPP